MDTTVDWVRYEAVLFDLGMAVLELLDHHSIPQAIVSSSKNARTVLTAAGMGDRFPVVVDGLTAAEQHPTGKPDPAMFLHAAELLGVESTGSVVVEDASSGVAAEGFALVLGVDRGGNAEALAVAGADLVVDDLADTLASHVQFAPGRADT
jgi:beta-phosphoglucomutase-like phosphatase (HAD superfamily)